MITHIHNVKKTDNGAYNEPVHHGYEEYLATESVVINLRPCYYLLQQSSPCDLHDILQRITCLA